jgi:poly(A) polymerase
MPDSSSGRPPARIDSAPWLQRPQTQAVLGALAAGGHLARAVGGAVRNSLLGLPVSDVDIATTALPEEVMAAAQAAGLGAVPTGLAHGTVTVIADGVPFEVTTLRRDVETHGRHATVAFTDDWMADARRRDFTLNALYCSADGEVFDPLGGHADLMARRIRFIGDAGERIREDYLRILRFFRFNARFGEGTPDSEGLAACVRERAGLAILSGERVRAELLALLAAPRGIELVGTMFDYGLLPAILGAAPRPPLLGRLAAIEARLALPPDAILRLAALGVEVAEDAERLQERLRLSNAEADTLAHAAERELGVSPPGERAARAALYASGPERFRQQVLLAWTRSGAASGDAAWGACFALSERWQAPAFPISGADVLAHGIPAGPRVGELLRALEAWWIERDFAPDAAMLRARLAELAGDPR